MEPRYSRICRFAAGVLSILSVAAILWGQEASSTRQNLSLATDWSHRHLVYSSQGAAFVPVRFAYEPRYWQQLLRRGGGVTQSGDMLPLPIGLLPARPRRFKRDWAVSLGPGATVGAGQFPAKFSFDVTKAQCASDPMPDYVAFNTSVAGSSTQATIVAYDNLYVGGCSGTVPSTYWAYNTGGTVLTSATMSKDGMQLAFVQTVSSQAQLVLLKWQASATATSTSPGAITSVTASQYSSCTAPCMTTLAFSGGANDTNSSPFVDYANHVIYVGDDAGKLHKFTSIFTAGTPAEVTSPWPVTVASGLKLSSPVYDSGTGRVFVGSAFSGSGSQLFAVVAATGVVAGTSSSLGQGTGLASSPIVDSSAGKVFVFVGNDGTTNCFAGPCSAVHQFATNFTSGAGVTATLGRGGALPIYTGDFDNAYFTSANSTGTLYVCSVAEFGPPEPSIFSVPINAGTMSTSSAPGPALGTSNTACSPVTDVFNPASPGTDRLFASVPNSGDGAGCSSGGCITDLITTAWQPSTTYTVGQRILDPGVFWQVVVIGGTSKSGAHPFWNETCGLESLDNTVTWADAGFATPVNPQGWQAHTVYSAGSSILDSNNNLECGTVNNGQSGATQPMWNTTLGGTTLDAGQTWRNVGPPSSHSLFSAGGTSGVILDNVVGSGTLAGASQIYFSTLGTTGCGAGNGCAVQASQAALN